MEPCAHDEPLAAHWAARLTKHGDAWSELEPADGPTARERVRERLRQAERKGYELVLLWPDEGWEGPVGEDPLKFSREAQLGLSDYIAGPRG